MRLEPKEIEKEILDAHKDMLLAGEFVSSISLQKDIMRHILWQEQEIASLKKSLRAWIHKFTNLVIENEELKRKPVRYRNE